MALTAIISVSQGVLPVNQFLSVTLEVRNSSDAPAVITGVTPSITPSGSAALGDASGYPASIAAGQTLVFNWKAIIYSAGTYGVSGVISWVDGASTGWRCTVAGTPGTWVAMANL